LASINVIDFAPFAHHAIADLLSRGLAVSAPSKIGENDA
jgi:hypothetical protein